MEKLLFLELLAAVLTFKFLTVISYIILAAFAIHLIYGAFTEFIFPIFRKSFERL